MVDTPEPGIYYIVLYPYWLARGLPLDYTLTVWVLPFNEVSGVIDLLDYDGDMTQIPVLIQIRNPGEVTPIGQHEVFLDSSGRFYFVTSLEGVYDFAGEGTTLAASRGTRCANHLVYGSQFHAYQRRYRRRQRGNLVRLRAAGSRLWQRAWCPTLERDADLDGDEEVTLFDFGVLVRNFGVMGDE
jgi:hypothetical protein